VEVVEVWEEAKRKKSRRRRGSNRGRRRLPRFPSVTSRREGAPRRLRSPNTRRAPRPDESEVTPSRRRRRRHSPLTRPGFESRTSRRRFASRWTGSGFQTRFASRRRWSWRRLRQTRRAARSRPRRRRRSRPSWTRPWEGTDAPVERRRDGSSRLKGASEGGAAHSNLTTRLEKKTRILRGSSLPD